MKRIDRETVQRILDAADIVEVVSDFVNLKKRGANYIGLCPFHNERTPSFSVSRARGICKCFSCGKGGSPVGFIMELEQMSYNDALRYLAKKYHIEIKEYEMTDEDREKASQRDAMLAVNDYALNQFKHNLTDTDDGRDIGLSYFRHRGISDQMIERFALGYSLDKSDALYKSAIAHGYSEKYLIETGLCSRNERGTVYDRFRGRVMYPVFSVSGRVVAFGGRTLRNDKKMAKYVNSPESPIYHKSNELYGLYQAKRAISKQDKCILVEGYMDVISMHQAGVENVVASSGTSLTDGQIRLIRRFTNNVTVIYDSDAAGIKASLRGIDMLLAEGMNIKVLLLPDGDDPDSFAQHHSSAEVEEYIKANETDFMQFKTRILLDDAKNDPVRRAGVANDIINSIAVIPDPIVRAEYIKECAHMLQIDERTITLQMQRQIAQNAGRRPSAPRQEPDAPTPQPAEERPQAESQQEAPAPTSPGSVLYPYEKELIKYVVKYGMSTLTQDTDDGPVKVVDYIKEELSNDGIAFTHPCYSKIFALALETASTTWPADLQEATRRADAEYQRQMAEGIDVIRQSARDLADIETQERQLKQVCDTNYTKAIDDYADSYLIKAFISHPDDDVRTTATDLATDRYVLSKVHSHYTHIPTERERLIELVPRAVAELKFGIINQRICENLALIKGGAGDIMAQLKQQKELNEMRNILAEFLGERVILPPQKH